MSDPTNLTQFTIDKLNAIYNATAAALPKATALAVEATRWDCWTQITAGWFLLGIASVFIIITAWLCWKAYVLQVRWLDVREKVSPATLETVEWTWIPFWIIGIIELGTFTIVIFVIALIKVLDLWTWIGLKHPELYMVHQIIERAKG